MELGGVSDGEDSDAALLKECERVEQAQQQALQQQVERQQHEKPQEKEPVGPTEEQPTTEAEKPAARKRRSAAQAVKYDEAASALGDENDDDYGDDEDVDEGYASSTSANAGKSKKRAASDEEALSCSKPAKKRAPLKKAMKTEDADAVGASSAAPTKKARAPAKTSKSGGGGGGGGLEQIVLEYLRAQCRPFNAVKIWENLNKTASQPAVKAALASLTTAGGLRETLDATGKAVLWWPAPVAESDGDDRGATIAALKATLVELRESLASLHARRAAAAAALAEIEAQPADCDLDAAIDTVVARRLSAVAALAALVESQKLAQATVDESSVDLGAAKLEKAFFKREGDQRRAAVMSAVGMVAEGTGRRPAEIMVRELARSASELSWFVCCGWIGSSPDRLSSIDTADPTDRYRRRPASSATRLAVGVVGARAVRGLCK
jgi:hypothetical protein